MYEAGRPAHLLRMCLPSEEVGVRAGCGLGLCLPSEEDGVRAGCVQGAVCH